MNHYLYLQSLCYDRPRFMHDIYLKAKTISEVDDFIQSSSRYAQFESLYLYRKKQFDQLPELLNKNKISVVSIDHPHYPVSFHQLHDPPLALFYIGDMDLCLGESLGVVGSRRPSVLAQNRINQLVGSLD